MPISDALAVFQQQIEVVNSPTSFSFASESFGGGDTGDSLIGRMVVIEQTDEAPNFRRCTAYSDVSKTITIDSACSFALGAGVGDYVTILAMPAMGPQETRDAMKLARSAGAPETDSLDELVESSLGGVPQTGDVYAAIVGAGGEVLVELSDDTGFTITVDSDTQYEIDPDPGYLTDYIDAPVMLRQHSGLENLTACWLLESAAATITDSVNGIVLTKVGTPTVGAGLVTSNAIEFDSGTPDSYYVEDLDLMSLGGDINFEFGIWVYLMDDSAEQCIFAKDDIGGTREYSLRFDSGNFIFECSEDGAGDTIHSVSVSGGTVLNTWKFLLCGRDATTDEIFISVNNGSKQTASSPTTFNGSWQFQLGIQRTSNPLKGRLNAFAFYKGGLWTTDEEAWLYNSGDGNDPNAEDSFQTTISDWDGTTLTVGDTPDFTPLTDRLKIEILDSAINSFTSTDRATLLGAASMAATNHELTQTINDQTSQIATHVSSILDDTGSSGVQIDLAQTVPTSNTAGTTGDALSAARAQAFGKMVLDHTTRILTIYGPDDTTIIATHLIGPNLTAPLTRTPQ